MSLLNLQDVSFGYTASKAILKGVDLAIQPGDSIGLVGESGSGKSTLLRLMLGLYRPSGGTITFDGAPLDPRNDRFMRNYRRQVQIVFQDPYSSLDPRQSVFSIIAEPLRSLRIPGDHRKLVADAIASVGLDPNIVSRYAHEFSGGQRQRIAIARAIVPGPRLLLADEAVSALDLSTRIRIVDLFKQLSAEMTLVFVSHDIGVVAALCSKIVILEQGRIVEAGPTAQILANPQHPYTQLLLQSVPRMPA
jgi:ABC-type dipeptide/oligopeptide/nickel transport system ATPase subunit